MKTFGKCEIGWSAARPSRPGQTGWIGPADRSSGGRRARAASHRRWVRSEGGHATITQWLADAGLPCCDAAVPPGVFQRWWVGWGGPCVIDDIGHVPRCPDAAGHGVTAGRATKGDHHEAAQACTCVDLFGGALRRGRAASQRVHDAVDRTGPVSCGVPYSGLVARCGKPVAHAPVVHGSACSRVQKQVRSPAAHPAGDQGP